MADLSVLRRVMRVSCLAVGFILAIGLAAIWEGDPGTLLTADYRTAPDETRLIDLADGSQVMLGPSSALALRFDGRRRGFDLLSGIAYVTASQTAADPAFRPFRVNAGRGAATALGTQYMVEVLDDTVRVTVAEHDVEVSLPLETGVSEKVILHPGDSVRYSARSGIQSVERVSLARATGWRDGRLVFDRVPLAEVVAVLNRYRRGKIVIANPDLAVRTVSGSFNTSELDHALHAIARELRATTTALPPFVTLLF
ncbi:FecR family protein [Hwanghaeella sp.]|uniref:FecR family protein n=1 Tax=Hwanghaeella sp. TaxID=2605943 RepID=UPI003CCBBCAD